MDGIQTQNSLNTGSKYVWILTSTLAARHNYMELHFIHLPTAIVQRSAAGYARSLNALPAEVVELAVKIFQRRLQITTLELAHRGCNRWQWLLKEGLSSRNVRDFLCYFKVQSMTIIAFKFWNAVLRCACHYCNVMMQGQWSTQKKIQLQFTECGFTCPLVRHRFRQVYRHVTRQVTKSRTP